MKRVSNGVAFAFIVISILAANCPADARVRDKPNYGYCKSGNVVANVKNCRENGGTR
jgi:hypothetical protein